MLLFFFFQAEDGIRDVAVTGVQTCALPISGVVSPCQVQTRRLGGSTSRYVPVTRCSVPSGAGRRRVVKAQVILGAITPLFRASPDAWLRRRPRSTVVAIGLGLVAALAYADASVASDLAPLVYLAPIGLVAWYAGRWAGALVALTGTGAWLLTDAAGRGFPPAMVVSWDALVRLAAFLVVAVMMAALREALDRERQGAPAGLAP